MPDIDRNLKVSNPVNIVGGDENFAADVINETGIKKLWVKTVAEISSGLRINEIIPVPDVTMSDTVFYTMKRWRFK